MALRATKKYENAIWVGGFLFCYALEKEKPRVSKAVSKWFYLTERLFT